MPSFSNFSFDESILKVLNEIGYDKPTPIQERIIPKVLEGLDVIASAPTGTGKTGAFMLPTLQLLSTPGYKNNRGPHVLVLVPTRELAMQVAEEAKKYSKYLPKTKTVCIYGGAPYPVQRKALSGYYEILVATPGRLMDHMEQGRINLSDVKMLVLDEADRMLDMGFVSDVEFIASKTPAKKQTLLFSATIDRKIIPFSQKIQNNPVTVDVTEKTAESQSHIEQRLYYVDNINHKIQLLENILENTEIKQGIIFTSTKNQADELADYLDEKGYETGALHGDMNQRQRSRTINKLRVGDIQLLIATDVAARGIDIPSLSHVINFDLPFQPEDFIHRVGRTGRAGSTGLAITFSTYKEDFRVVKINRLLGVPITIHTIKGLEPKSNTNERSRGSHQGESRRFGRPGNKPQHSRGKPEFSRKDVGPKVSFKGNSRGPRKKPAYNMDRA